MVTFLEAARQGRWIRRRGRSKVICVSENPTNLYNMVRSDFLADDWELATDREPDRSDDAAKRFSLMELDE